MHRTKHSSLVSTRVHSLQAAAAADAAGTAIDLSGLANMRDTGEYLCSCNIHQKTRVLHTNKVLSFIFRLCFRYVFHIVSFIALHRRRCLTEKKSYTSSDFSCVRSITCLSTLALVIYSLRFSS